jgi:hypothetical protein
MELKAPQAAQVKLAAYAASQVATCKARAVLDYLLSPVAKAVQEAGREK